MNKFNKILLGIALIQVVLLVVVSFSGDGRSSTTTEPRKLVALDAADVKRLTITDAEKAEIVLGRGNEGWTLEGADNYPAKSDLLETPAKSGDDATPIPARTGILDKITALTVSRPILRKAENHGPVKVADDKFERRIVLEGKDGKELAKIYLASGSQSGTAYVRLHGTDEVYQTKDLRMWDFTTTQSTWFDGKLVDLAMDDVRSFTAAVAEGDKSFAFELREEPKKDDGKKEEESGQKDETGQKSDDAEAAKVESWWITSPSQEKGDKSAIEAVLGRLTTLRFNEVLSRTAPSTLDTSKPIARFEMVMRDGSKHEVLVGAKDGDGNYPVKYSGNDWFGTASSWSIDSAMELDLEKLREAKPEEQKDGDEKK